MYGDRSTLSHRDNRAALFDQPSKASRILSGGRSSRSESPLPMHYPKHLQQIGSTRRAEDLETQNDDLVQGLSAKVRLLKDITTNIGNEVRDSTKMLGGMNDTFDETSGYLGTTFKKMNRMARKQGGQWCLWMAFLFIVFLVFLWTWLFRRR
ncbi:protein transport protein bet1 [Microbotryomycetes sp. JL221]|nr:protein transport protein bet1 [Microbotryomycetes sp. JL221]